MYIHYLCVCVCIYIYIYIYMYVNTCDLMRIGDLMRNDNTY